MIKSFVDIEWVERHRGEIVLADCRWYLDGRSGRDAYRAGHIPGAVFVDLDTALTRQAEPAEEGRHPMAEPEAFAAAMGALGIGDDDTVVAYDDAGGVIAARLVWMLRVTGHEAALLDGGLAAWRGELEAGPRADRPEAGEADAHADAVDLSSGHRAKGRPHPRASRFTARPWPVERLAPIDEAASAALSGTAAVIDGRPHERYLGEPDEVDPRAGHVPGALSVPCRENLDADGRLLPVEDLRARFDFGERTEVISYCGSGVTACHNLLAMEQAGLGPGRLFVGSWSQWSRDPSRPAETAAPSTP